MMWRFHFRISNQLDGFKKNKIALGNYCAKEISAEKHGDAWYITIYAKGDSHIELLENIIRDVEEILDKISFQLMSEILFQEITITNMSQIFRLNSKGDYEPLAETELGKINKIDFPKLYLDTWHFPQGFASQRGRWQGLQRLQATTRGVNPEISNKQLDAQDKNALKWFVKALNSINEVDRFTSYIICLDILSHKLPLNQRKPICSKCNTEIEYSHICGEPLQTQPYAMDYLIGIGLGEEQARKFNKLRNAIFHGRKSLSSERLEEVLELNDHLKLFLTKKLKNSLGIAENQAPILEESVVMVTDMALGVYEDCDYDTFVAVKTQKFH